MANDAKALDVSEENRQVLQPRVQARTVSVRDLERARIVLLAAMGQPAAEIAARMGCSRQTCRCGVPTMKPTGSMGWAMRHGRVRYRS